MITRNPTKSLWHVAVLAVALGLVAGAALATNGYLIHGIGTRAKALAGAGVAFPQDALAPGTNPAGLAFIGERYDAGMGLFSPRRQYTVSGFPSGPPQLGLLPGTVQSDSEVFFVPNFGASWKLSDGSSVGLAVYGQGGMNTDYPTATFFGSSPTGVDLSQMFIVPAWANRVGSGKHAFGITPILAVQFFEAQGLQAFRPFSSGPTKLSDNGHDQSTGLGFRFGYLGKFSDDFSFGFSLQTEISMDEFGEYAGLFAEHGGFDIPFNWTVGIAYEVGAGGVFMLDYQEILFGAVASVGNPMFPALGRAFVGDPSGQMGMARGPGFGWQDMSVIKAGYQWGAAPWTWRVGFSTGDQPIPPSEMLFNILAPGVMEEHITAGFTRELGTGRAFSLSLMHAPSSSVSGANALELPGQQTIELEMEQWDLELGFSWGM
jgi:long-chain fatty acid transport protein